MPTVNIYYVENGYIEFLRYLIPDLKTHLAVALSCNNRTLRSDEISVRLLKTAGVKRASGQIENVGMLGDIELEINAYAYPERVKKQDEICREVSEFVKKFVNDETYAAIGDVRTWLILSELGHDFP